MAPGILVDPVINDSPLRQERQLKTVNSTCGWPTQLSGDLVWHGSDLKEEDYIYNLTAEDKAEIEEALNHFTELELDGHEIDRTNFPLPKLGERLLAFATDIHRGRGFLNIRGLDPRDYSHEDNLTIFMGVSSYIAELRAKQDEDGNMLTHISNAKHTKEDQKDRPTRYSNRASTFHTDTFCDVLALQTRSCAAQGGGHLVSSSWRIYNKIAATRPDLVDVLAQPGWPFDSRGKLFEPNLRPLLFYHGGKVILNFSREPLTGIDGVARYPGLPTLTPQQREALDILEATAREGQLLLQTRPGDLTFINNHAILHSREAFVDNQANSRYLIRMWLKNRQLAWKLPRPLQMSNSRIYDDNELEEKWNLTPEVKLRFQISERLGS